MKCFFPAICLVLSALESSGGIPDPVRDYLRPDRPRAYADNTTGEDPYYSDDKVFRLELDLNNDGKKEVLISSTKDRDGKAGNIWTVYKQEENDFSEVGTITFNPNRIYLGQIDQTGSFGLVTFVPGGGGEGSIYAYVFDDSKIEGAEIGEVIRDPATGKLKGNEVWEKYSEKKTVLPDSATRTIDASELAQTYGVRVESKTSLQAVERDLRAPHDTAKYQTPLVTASASQALPSSATQSMLPAGQSSQPASPTLTPQARESSTTFSIVLVFIVLLFLAAVVVAMVRRKSL
jgi:hypothetical protein